MKVWLTCDQLVCPSGCKIMEKLTLSQFSFNSTTGTTWPKKDQHRTYINNQNNNTKIWAGTMGSQISMSINNRVRETETINWHWAECTSAKAQQSQHKATNKCKWNLILCRWNKETKLEFLHNHANLTERNESGLVERHSCWVGLRNILFLVWSKGAKSVVRVINDSKKQKHLSGSVLTVVVSVTQRTGWLCVFLIMTRVYFSIQSIKKKWKEKKTWPS